MKTEKTSHWYAIYTRSRNEKKACEEIRNKGIEVFLPLIKTLKQWSDRKKWVEEPLFRSYLFVYIKPEDYYKVLNTPGLVRYITFEGKAVPIPQVQIDAIKYYIGMEDYVPDEAIDYAPGDKVEITHGPLQGLSGELIQLKGKSRMKVQIDALGQSIMLTVPVNLLARIEITNPK